MRNDYIIDGIIDEQVVLHQARQRDEITFIHYHPYSTECEARYGCYLIFPSEVVDNVRATA